MGFRCQEFNLTGVMQLVKRTPLAQFHVVPPKIFTVLVVSENHVVLTLNFKLVNVLHLYLLF